MEKVIDLMPYINAEPRSKRPVHATIPLVKNGPTSRQRGVVSMLADLLDMVMSILMGGCLLAFLVALLMMGL